VLKYLSGIVTKIPQISERVVDDNDDILKIMIYY